MDIDIPHLFATMVVLAVAILVSDHLGWKEKGKFSWKLFALIFVAILALNLAWPYAA
ncbi:hypothetical protein [Sphingomicrobium sediminis]|uniref:Uncharacterized protein n=1 Tax=Sphingomicrobium sediminis TaxID=2950949 RepID=A0A9X2J318_9SPHN|nr:hypothetical protein [Sphingomicrobium sediminis]MCM8557620.1 hypothetical protein [Sphingomicrobium sediminis]